MSKIQNKHHVIPIAIGINSETINSGSDAETSSAGGNSNINYKLLKDNCLLEIAYCLLFIENLFSFNNNRHLKNTGNWDSSLTRRIDLW